MGEVTSGRAALGSWGPLGGLIGWTLRRLPGAGPTALASAITPRDACVATSRDDAPCRSTFGAPVGTSSRRSPTTSSPTPSSRPRSPGRPARHGSITSPDRAANRWPPLPVIERRYADAELSAEVGDGQFGFGLSLDLPAPPVEPRLVIRVRSHAGHRGFSRKPRQM